LQEDMSSSQQTPKGPYVPKEVDFNQRQWWVDHWKLGFELDQQENLGKPAPRMVTLTTKEQLSFCHSLAGWCSIQETRAHLVLFIRVASVTYFVALSLSIYTYNYSNYIFFWKKHTCNWPFACSNVLFLAKKKNRCRGMWTTVGVAGELLLGFLWADGDGGGAPWVYGFCTTQDLLLMLWWLKCYTR
jgi:hypothetical protein